MTARKETGSPISLREVERYPPRRASPAVALLRPGRGLRALRLGELWEYRELLYFLTWRNIKLRYKQTALGALWAVIQPFCTMVVFSIVFGAFAGLSSDGAPYPVFSYVALVPWTYFAGALAQASSSMVEHEHMITKLYFPRLLVPIAAVITGLVDFAIAFVVLIGMMLFYGIALTPAILALPLFVALTVLTALAVGIWFAVLNVEYRDVRYVIPFVLQVWLFATPIAYPSSLVPAQWRALYGLNPMVGVIEGFRWALLGTSDAPWAAIALASCMVLALLAGGLLYFRRAEATFADVI